MDRPHARRRFRSRDRVLGPPRQLFFMPGVVVAFPLFICLYSLLPFFFLEKVKSVLFGSFYPLILLRLEHQIDS